VVTKKLSNDKAVEALKNLNVPVLVFGEKEVVMHGGSTTADAIRRLTSFKAGTNKVKTKDGDKIVAKSLKASAAASGAFKRSFKASEVHAVQQAIKHAKLVPSENGKALVLDNEAMFKNTALKLIDDSLVRRILKALGKRSVTYADVVTLQIALKLEFYQKFVAKLASGIQTKKQKLSESYFSGSDTMLIPIGTPELKCSPLWLKQKNGQALENPNVVEAIQKEIKDKKPPNVLYVGSIAQGVCDGHVTIEVGEDKKKIFYSPFKGQVDNLLAFTYTGTLFTLDSDDVHKPEYQASLDAILKTIVGEDAYDEIPMAELPCESLLKARCLARFENEKAFQQ
jgi:hypothetical protein